MACITFPKNSLPRSAGHTQRCEQVGHMAGLWSI